MIVRDSVLRDRAVDDVRDGCLAHLAEVLADPVGDDDRFVDRIAEHREHGGEHRQRELPLEQRKEAQDDDDVVQVGDDRRDGEAPLEPQREVDDDADRHQQQRERAVLVELLADLRARRTRRGCCVTPGSSAFSAPMTRSDSCALETPSFSGSRISAVSELPKLCAANSPRLSLSIALRTRLKSTGMTRT